MINTSASASFSNSRSGGIQSAYVKLEQVEIKYGKGIVTKTKLVQGLSAAVFGGIPPQGDCGLEVEGGNTYFTVGIHAYYFPANLIFEARITHGFLSGGITKLVKLQERVKFKLSNTSQVRYGISNLVSIKWESPGNKQVVWDENGAQIPPPRLEINDNELTTANFKKVYGVAVVTYYTRRKEYTARIYARGNVPENLFQSVAWARWDGGVDMEQLNSPTGASSDTLSGTACYNRTGSTDVTGKDDDDVPRPKGSDRTCDVNYCEFELVDENCGNSK